MIKKSFADGNFNEVEENVICMEPCQKNDLKNNK